MSEPGAGVRIADGPHFYKALSKGRTYHVEVNGSIREQFKCPRTCTVNVPLGNYDFDIFDGVAPVQDIADQWEAAPWKGRISNGTGWEALLTMGLGVYMVKHDGAPMLHAEVTGG